MFKTKDVQVYCLYVRANGRCVFRESFGDSMLNVLSQVHCGHWSFRVVQSLYSNYDNNSVYLASDFVTGLDKKKFKKKSGF